MNAFLDYFRQRQQSGSFCTILAVSIESSGVVDSLTEMPQPGQRQIKASPFPASDATNSTPAAAKPMFAE
ncbi:hypothetical protein C1X34_30765 [Pseudomonas sp. GW456-12-10-14-TSB6]|nr:hypothetical protein C1X55_29640 [Pseudomonas sp. GW460-C8]PMW10533.1 hypothetical protein C1X40_30210 [Pseudomonas sp. GW456-11-11-14-TSB2]PMW12496.1 hypothetical protein C1X53_30680 [Pseudomonas sp. GW456-E6]PMW28800.1 hypothetical protein C1X45_30195 [Pseudomonas sp. GW460-7]PMW41255.1 hypothetical protein C1X48_07370 [Pseudomonas sp. FW305-3-2-15-A-R2A1]PMW57834.1 hypothetical protein C1X31_24760 [Pseudomonas sp. GW456-11-11-14-LB2]PMW62847.1 hypothetical protein C1X39_04355 [Pseudomon